MKLEVSFVHEERSKKIFFGDFGTLLKIAYLSKISVHIQIFILVKASFFEKKIQQSSLVFEMMI